MALLLASPHVGASSMGFVWLCGPSPAMQGSRSLVSRLPKFLGLPFGPDLGPSRSNPYCSEAAQCWAYTGVQKGEQPPGVCVGCTVHLSPQPATSQSLLRGIASRLALLKLLDCGCPEGAADTRAKFTWELRCRVWATSNDCLGQKGTGPAARTVAGASGTKMSGRGQTLRPSCCSLYSPPWVPDCLLICEMGTRPRHGCCAQRVWGQSHALDRSGLPG